jgi:hypothetical protein
MNCDTDMIEGGLMSLVIHEYPFRSLHMLLKL